MEVKEVKDHTGKRYPGMKKCLILFFFNRLKREESLVLFNFVIENTTFLGRRQHETAHKTM